LHAGVTTTTTSPPQVLGRTVSSRQLESAFADFLVFAIPALEFVQIQVVGRLFATDVLVLATLPFALLARGHRLAAPFPRKLILLGMLWLASQMITDFVRQTPFNDYARGWAKIAFFLASFGVLYVLAHNRPRRLVLYGIGLVVGGVLSFYLSPRPHAEVDPWKFGLGEPVTLLLILIATSRSVRRLPAEQLLVLAFGALMNLYLGFRALSGVCFLAATYIATRRLKARGHELSLRNVALFTLISLGAGLGFLRAYEYAADKGILGTSAQRKYETQAAGELGVLIGARWEILVSASAIKQSPILGYGSWARNPQYAWLPLDLLRSFGYNVDEGDVSGADLIPTHSYLFSAWVEAGVLGGVFWLWILLVATRALTVLRRTPDSRMPLIAFAGFMLIWNVLFSPFGAEQRFMTAYYIVLLLYVLENARSEQPRA